MGKYVDCLEYHRYEEKRREGRERKSQSVFLFFFFDVAFALGRLFRPRPLFFFSLSLSLTANFQPLIKPYNKLNRSNKFEKCRKEQAAFEKAFPAKS